MRAGRLLSAAGLAVLLAACATVPPGPTATGPDAATLQSAVAAIRQAGTALPTELDVQPVRDPEVTDLQEDAERFERAGRLADAAAALDRALAIAMGDPALLQLRAEVSLLQGDVGRAITLARRVQETGPQVGPLCRRALETLAQAAVLAPSEEASVDALRSRRDACTVTPPPRY